MTPAGIPAPVITVQVNHPARTAQVIGACLRTDRNRLVLHHLALTAVAHQLQLVSAAQGLLKSQAQLGLRYRFAGVEADGPRVCLEGAIVQVLALQTLWIQRKTAVLVEHQHRPAALVHTRKLQVGIGSIGRRLRPCTVGGKAAHIQGIRPTRLFGGTGFAGRLRRQPP